MSSGRQPFDVRARQALGALSLSLACHGLILIILMFFTWAVGGSGDSLRGEFTATLVAEAKGSSPEGGFRFPGQANRAEPDSAEKDDAVHDLASLLRKDSSLQVKPVDVGGTDLSTIAVSELSRSDVVGTSVVGGSPESGLGDGLGDRDHAGGGPVGSLWGVGAGQQARSVVYVMDRSGSMSDTISLLQRELLRAIGRLEPDQSFNVIWFNEGKATLWSRRMQKATIDNKREAFDQIKNIQASGQTEPMDAVTRALGFQPDVMFLLSDGDFGEYNETVIRLFEKKNKRRRTIVNTILFIFDTGGDGGKTLSRIARMNGGTYKHVTEDDVRR